MFGFYIIIATLTYDQVIVRQPNLAITDGCFENQFTKFKHNFHKDIFILLGIFFVHNPRGVF